MKTQTRESDCPSVWFMILERAKHAHNFELAAEAQRKLEALGVRVEYLERPTTQDVSNAG